MSLRFGALLGAVALLVACQEELPGPTVFDGVSLDSAPPEETRVSDAPAPPAPRLLLTFNELPRALNGSEPYSWAEEEQVAFRPRANALDMTLDLLLESESGPVDWDQTSLGCGVESLDASLLEIRSDRHARLRFTAERPFSQDGAVTCIATVAGPGGEDTQSVILEASPMPEKLDPFVSPDVWLVVLDRDIFELQVTVQEGGTFQVTSAYEPAGNGMPDLDEALMAIGLMSSSDAQAASLARSALLSVIRDQTRQMFGLDASGQRDEESVPLTLFFQGDAGAPLWTAYDGKSFSMIALGGDGTPDEQLTGLVGRALLDPNNQDQENNTTYGLGVYPSAIIRQVLEVPLGALTLAPIMPEVGVPMGELPTDAQAMDPGYEPSPTDPPELVERHQLYRLVVELLGQALAATLAHEIGHSIGLVPPGAPPEGLFAGLPGLNLTDYDIEGWHIDTPGLNVMQTGAVTNWIEAVGQPMRFNPLNIAYLRRRLVVGAIDP